MTTDATTAEPKPLPSKERRELGPNQLAWLKASMDVFRDAEKRAQEVIADTERMKREAETAQRAREMAQRAA